MNGSVQGSEDWAMCLEARFQRPFPAYHTDALGSCSISFSGDPWGAHSLPIVTNELKAIEAQRMTERQDILRQISV